MKRGIAVGSVLGLAALIGLDPGTGLAVPCGSQPIRATLASSATHVPAPTTTVLASDRNPSRFGHLVRLTARVTSATGDPTGSVDVVDGVTTVCDDVVLDAAGVAACEVRLRPDAHPLTATYTGDPDFATSSSAPLAQTVRAPRTATPGAQ
ncbi:Ig-like domain-containing protein [Sporichthya sp.]|uniref:Ig-like domain-containing protein n=1 Tax=Sporichthya sp. TaxID=65475 RepID=UPI0017D6DD6E|nr:Ig-like domain-containing protein [Sporichthya sp.]MBA3744159.1 Ig-like domain repeat protein [Sporichthya sp.]